MLRRIRRLPSPALVISVIALIAAVGGGTFAFAISDKKSDKKIAKKVANKQITKRAPSLSVNHANSADSANHANSAATSGNGYSAFTRISATGTVDPALSSGVAQSNVTHPGTGVYCISGLAVAPNSISAELDHIGSSAANPNPAVFVNLSSPASTGCPGAQAALIVVNAANSVINHGLYITLFH